MNQESGIWGIIGGTGLTALDGLEIGAAEEVDTPWGAPSGPLQHGRYAGKPVVFMARHGNPHRIPPHEINYRANLRAMRDAGVSRIIAVNAVGSINDAMSPASLVLPDQLVDYTWGRPQTFFEGNLEATTHIDFTWPYSASLRRRLLEGASEAAIGLTDGGVYACTQGPRLETAAEIHRLERDGCDLVGMTGMPEAVLARELGVDYVSLCLVVNWAAGKTENEITLDEIHANLEAGIGRVHALLETCLG
ncbi:methylthioadenosine phosphorylase [Halospina denitrificans]|uniref:Probable 6-oxopurine nucleoside phosphorylase n=1 Tax=Halospina denitrificans TaxID=332522 RepID=A0A4R7JNB3_9GAMM|nr:S-methyl-5'-thioinosine phosphorylase [Halospina denitrificans]TDT39325.1 methylthioadenosine phosphorylase [Halospina denitrificans]